MANLVFKLAGDDVPRDRLAVLLKHFSELSDEREAWRVMYPLAEVMLLLTCATICSCDDFDEIVAWGTRLFNAHMGIFGSRRDS